MNSYLLQADLIPTDFGSWVAELAVPADALAWVEWPGAWALDRWADLRGEAARLVGAGGGRVFHETGELRWRVLPCLGAASTRVVYLGTEPWPGLASVLQDQSSALTGLQPRRVQHVLWGEYYEPTGEWVELRIPQRFRYPLTARSRRVALVTELWESVTSGELGFVRYCGLQPFRGGDVHA
ncbi:MAG: hypothetical protein AB1445_01525 [Bacillota bacterium]